MATCSSCNNSLKFLETLKSFGGTKRCNQCIAKFAQASRHWSGLVQQHFDQGGVSATLEQAVHQNFQEINMPPDVAQPVLHRLQYLRCLSEIRWGNVPRIRTNHHLDSDEYAHFEMPATYHKPAKNVKLISGRLLGTNKKLYFLSSTGADSVTIDWNNVSMVENATIIEHMTDKVRSGNRTVTRSYQTSEHGIRLTVTKGSGGGAYIVNDPFYTKIIIDTLVKMWKRQLVIYQEQKTHGAIPEHVKAVVFQRDKGTCRQCGYTGEYIEYDHIIPRSKGGQNTVENIQLLCRKCNLRKSDRL
jgi:HNH endonuclease